MKKRTVISNVPTRLPVQSTILYSFLLWHFNINPIWWGVFITLYSILWVVVLIAKFNEKRIDLDKIEKEPAKSKFAQRIKQIIEEHK